MEINHKLGRIFFNYLIFKIMKLFVSWIYEFVISIFILY